MLNSKRFIVTEYNFVYVLRLCVTYLHFRAIICNIVCIIVSLLHKRVKKVKVILIHTIERNMLQTMVKKSNVICILLENAKVRYILVYLLRNIKWLFFVYICMRVCVWSYRC